MTLADLLTQLATLPPAEAKGYALVFGDAAHTALLDAQQHRESQHRAAPVRLSDGRWMLCADLLTEIHPGGLYADGFTLLPPEVFTQVDVIPWADAVALLPQPESQLERARDELGQFVADDPATPDVDEAWVTSEPPS
jgi:hypothetical protein